MEQKSVTDSAHVAFSSRLSSRAEQISSESLQVASKLAARSVVAKRNRVIVRGINIFVGGFAVAAAYIHPLPQMLGTSGVQLVGLAAAVVLILDGILPIFIGDDTPERLSEYAFYIRGFSGMLLDTLADDDLPTEVRRARLVELLAMANKNLEDARAKWPWVDA